MTGSDHPDQPTTLHNPGKTLLHRKRSRVPDPDEIMSNSPSCGDKGHRAGHRAAPSHRRLRKQGRRPMEGLGSFRVDAFENAGCARNIASSMPFDGQKAAKKRAPFPAQRDGRCRRERACATQNPHRRQTRDTMKSVPADQRCWIHVTASDTGAPLVAAHNSLSLAI